MVKVEIEKDRVSAENLFILQSFETQLTEFIRKQLNGDDYQHLMVAVDMRVVGKKGKPICVEKNASFEISGSYSFQTLVDKFIQANDALSCCLTDYSLIVKITYKERPMDNQKENKDKKRENETPDFIPVTPRYTFDQIILPDSTRKEILDALKVIECKDLIYTQWGFSEVDAVPRSVLNFHGKPGTGKTMCAHAIANYLGKKFLALNYSEIESKYVGEAPKNLVKAFETAKKLDAVLFFDEADSFLGKRLENVSQGSDQALNSLRSQMLILLEEFPGIVLFATNLWSNFDEAFNSRILKHIEFQLPNREARVAILKKMLPSKLPLEAPFTEEQLLEASDKIEGFSGREIKSAVLDMLLSKADISKTDIRFSIDDLYEALDKKVEECKQRKEESTRRVKEKISKKLEEKAMEAEALKKQEEQMKGSDEIGCTKEEAYSTENA